MTTRGVSLLETIDRYEYNYIYLIITVVVNIVVEKCVIFSLS